MTTKKSAYRFDYPHEVRFAVVMYGGVSLAIYINGIAQELLRMVRASAVKSADKNRSNDENNPLIKYQDLKGSERVYRKLSYLLGDENKIVSEDALNENPAILRRFVIDIISGTSAGGINGVFLAKAMANGKDMGMLEKLWVQEGDISRLINDKQSVEKPLSLQRPPSSLLNSQRMYLKLLNALDDMDKAETGQEKKRNSEYLSYVDELNLFVTSTDIQGAVLPIQLTGDVVYERRHRNVMRFALSKEKTEDGKELNDFAAEYNPFLAYAARCTSAFPFAFEPMRLTDIDDVLDRLPRHRHDKGCKSDSIRWKKFYKDYRQAEGIKAVPFEKRSFGDGGYLDNKPFSYAVETLARRQSDVPVDRKLIYIEPSPEHPEEDIEVEHKPNALENVIAAVLKLPGTETIREDLERVRERNKTIRRINRIVRGVERDMDLVKSQSETHKDLGMLAPLTNVAENKEKKEKWALKGLSDKEWAELDLADMIKRKGHAYIAYHRLEVAAVTDDLAITVARAAGFNEESDYFLIVRSLFRAWRMTTYTEYRDDADKPKPTLNKFLYSFALSYSMRRINFIRRRIDELYRLDEQAKELIGFRDKDFWIRDGEGEEKKKKDFRDELLKIKQKMNEEYAKLRNKALLLRLRDIPKVDDKLASFLHENIKTLIHKINEVLATKDENDAGDPILNHFLGSGKDEKTTDCDERARQFLEKHDHIRGLVDQIGKTIKSIVQPAIQKTYNKCITRLDPSEKPSGAPPETPSNGALGARICLKYYFDNYDDYDMFIFPIVFDTPVGESDEVEIIRISPEDAKGLIDEKKSGVKKLAGTSFGHFGAFLNPLWRRNDILWGRLDGAERIINALLPAHPAAPKLIGEAQRAIVCETIEEGEMSDEQIMDLIVESLMRPKSGEADESALKTLTDFIKALQEGSEDQEVKNGLEGKLDAKKIGDHYRKVYETRSRLKPQETLETVARSTTVVGEMLSDISEQYNVSKKHGNWIARIGRILWGLVEVAVPQRIPNLFFYHWLKLLYMFEAILIIGSTLLLNPSVQKFAYAALAVTLGAHLSVLILGDRMRYANTCLDKIKIFVILLVSVLAILGVIFLVTISGSVDRFWSVLQAVRQWFEATDVTSLWSVRIGGIIFIIGFLLWINRGDKSACSRSGVSNAEGKDGLCDDERGTGAGL